MAKLTKKDRHFALLDVADYIANFSDSERLDYVNYCDENELDPNDIGNNGHVYARALVGLGLTFERE